MLSVRADSNGHARVQCGRCGHDDLHTVKYGCAVWDCVCDAWMPEASVVREIEKRTLQGVIKRLEREEKAAQCKKESQALSAKAIDAPGVSTLTKPVVTSPPPVKRPFDPLSLVTTISGVGMPRVQRVSCWCGKPSKHANGWCGVCQR